MLPFTGGTLLRNFMIFMCHATLQCTLASHNTLDAFFNVLVWSLMACKAGKWPSVMPDGVTPVSGKMAQMAGYALKYVFFKTKLMITIWILDAVFCFINRECLRFQCMPCFLFRLGSCPPCSGKLLHEVIIQFQIWFCFCNFLGSLSFVFASSSLHGIRWRVFVAGPLLQCLCCTGSLYFYRVFVAGFFFRALIFHKARFVRRLYNLGVGCDWRLRLFL